MHRLNDVAEVPFVRDPAAGMEVAPAQHELSCSLAKSKSTPGLAMVLKARSRQERLSLLFAQVADGALSREDRSFSRPEGDTVLLSKRIGIVFAQRTWRSVLRFERA